VPVGRALFCQRVHGKAEVVNLHYNNVFTGMGLSSTSIPIRFMFLMFFMGFFFEDFKKIVGIRDERMSVRSFRVRVTFFWSGVKKHFSIFKQIEKYWRCERSHVDFMTERNPAGGTISVFERCNMRRTAQPLTPLGDPWYQLLHAIVSSSRKSSRTFLRMSFVPAP